MTATGGSARASVTASSASVTAGYNPSTVSAGTTAQDTGNKTGNTVTTTAVTASDSSTVYLPKATFTKDGASVKSDTAGYIPASKTVGTISNATITSGAGTASATTTVAPGTVSVAKTSDGNVSTDTVTTSKPGSGYYVAVKATAAANTTGTTSKITGTVAAPSVETAGYVSLTEGEKKPNIVSGTATAKTSAKDSSVTYVPITSATTSKTDAIASASVTKYPSASTSVLGMDTTAVNTGFGVGASAASGEATASVTASSASVTAGYSEGISTSTKKASVTSAEMTATDFKYIIASSVTNNTTLPSGTSSSGTVNRGSYIKFGKGYNPLDKYYLAQEDAHDSYTPSATYFKNSTSGAVSAAKINKDQYATSDYYVKAGSATTPATTQQQSAPTFSKTGDVITASVAATSVDITPTISAGWVSSGTAGTVTMSANSAKYTIPTETKTIIQNGTFSPSSGKYFSSVTVAIPTYDGSVS